MADKTDKTDKTEKPGKPEAGEKPKKVYILKARKGAPPSPGSTVAPASSVLPVSEKKDPNAFGKTCDRCGAGLSNDRDALCGPCALAAAQEKAGVAPAPSALPPSTAKPEEGKTEARASGLSTDEPDPETFLDVMKQVLAEVERQNQEDDQIAKEVKEKFRIHDLSTANWAAGKIAMWQSEIDRRKRQSQEYIGEAERNVRRLKFLFMAQLEAWAKANIPQDRKHIKLPSATLKFTPTKDKLDILDEKKVVAWATVNCPDAVEMKPALQALKDWWLKGEKKEVPDGCEVIPPGENFNVV